MVTIPIDGGARSIAGSITRRVYVTTGNKTVVVLDSLSIVATVPIGGDLLTTITVDDSINRVYVGKTFADLSSVVVIDSVTNTITTTLAIDGVVGPVGIASMAANPTTHRLYVVGGGKVTVIHREFPCTLTPSLTMTSTSTQTSTDAPTDTFTPTPTQSATDTSTETPTTTLTPSATAIDTATRTFTPTPSETITQTVTPSNTVTYTPTGTLTSTGTSTPSATTTDMLTLTATATDTPTFTATPTLTLPPIITATYLPTNTASATQTETVPALVTATPLASNTPSRTITLTPSGTPTATDAVTVSATATVTLTVTQTPTVPGTATRTVMPSNTGTPTNTAGTNLTFYRAINIGGPALVIDGNNWAANTGTTPNFTTNGMRLCAQWRTLTPPTDTNRSQMIRCYREHWAFNMAMTNVPSGTYAVYIYVWQSWDDPSTTPYDIVVEGQTIVSNYHAGNIGGKWERLGPWTVNVSDGTLNLTTNGAGLADISGVEVYQLTIGIQPSATPTTTASVVAVTTGTVTPTATSTNTTGAGTSATPSRTATTTRTPSRTPTATITLGATPTFYRAYNLGGPAITIDGRNWLSGTSPELNIENATSICNQTVPLVPATDANRSQMIRCSVTGSAINVEVTDVANGFYDVYIYIWEDNAPSTFSIALQGGQIYVPNINSGSAGAWKRYGPYTINVTGGWMSIDSNGGQANFSGIELYRR